MVDGKFVERSSVSDMLDAFRQPGVIGYSEEAKKILPEDVP